VTADNIASKFYSNVGIVQNLYSAINDGNITDQQIDGATDAGVDLFNYEIGLYTSEGIIPGIGFIPINLELTMDGLSGMRIYESYTADTKLLPPRYKDSIQYVITGISHKIQNNDWTTTIQSISGPRYTGFVPKASPQPVKSHSVTRKKQTTYKNPTTVTDTDTANTTVVTAGVVSGTFREINDMKEVNKTIILNNTKDLVLLREATDGVNTIGAMYYQGKRIAATIEDAIRESKVNKKTAIPTGIYNITLQQTATDSIRKAFVDFGDGKGFVGPRVGTSSDGVTLDGPGNLDFTHIRIHGGTTSASSAGCIIVSGTRKSDGTLVLDYDKGKEITRLIKRDNIKKIIVINDF